MKQLQLTPPLLLVTMGYPGAGKTYFARQFSEQYEIARISEDRIRSELFEQPQFNGDESDIISRIMLYMVEQIMHTKQTLICEGGFMQQRQRKELEKIAKTNGYRTLFVWVQTDIETSAARAATRDRRSADSRFSFPINRSTFNKIKDTLERPTEKEFAVVVSGKHAFKSQSMTVLKKIASMYTEAIAKNIPDRNDRTVSRIASRPIGNQKIIQ